MEKKKYVMYIRVSTQKQGRSGLGLESQMKICNDFISANGGECVDIFKDVESGTHRDRKGLLAAVEYCKKNGCALVLAKLDRLARDVEFCFKVVNTGIEIHFCDMPSVNTLLLGVFATVAQYERELTSDRTKKALAVKKEQGCKLGASSEVYRLNYAKKSKEEKKAIGQRRGETKRKRYIESNDVQVFMKALRNVFPDATTGDVREWNWNAITTRNGVRQRVLSIMRDYHDFSCDVFSGWDFSDLDSPKLQTKLASYIVSLKRNINK